MGKKAFLRGLLGLPLGVAIGYGITIGISLVLADGNYWAAVPMLVEEMGSEIYAVVLQAGLCGLLGAAFAAMSVIWELESWSIAKQTGVHFGLASLVMMPIAYFTHWMERSVKGFLVYFGIFAVLFLVVWVVMYIVERVKIGRLNEKLTKN